MLKLDLQFFAGGFVGDTTGKDAPDSFCVYNGESVYIAVGQTLTFHCTGKKMKTDFSACLTSNGTVTYNGTEIAVAAGETIVLSCAGKKMASDVTVAIPETVAPSAYNITTNFVGCYGASINPTEINEGEEVVLSVYSESGYSFISGLYVSGAEYEWAFSTEAATIIIRNPTGPVYVSLSCVQAAYSITTTVGNGYVLSSSATEITHSAGVYVQANSGYLVPTSVQVSGADYTWHPSSDRSSGYVVLHNAQSEVFVNVYCIVDESALPPLS